MFDVILLIKSFDIWNIIGLLISISLLVFFTKELKRDGN
ncbi:putative membrane protein [Clostridioides difficile F314]|nr:putative membrane protein [Clostridioides difficile F314]